MKNKNGMVVAEVLVALIVCGIILMISIHMFKSNDLSKTPFVYSVMKNLPMVNMAVQEDCYKEGRCSQKRQLPTSRTEYCLRLSDNLTTTGEVDCNPANVNNVEIDEDAEAVSGDEDLQNSTQDDYRENGSVKYYYNFRMTNGVAFYGLTNTNNGTSGDWQSIPKGGGQNYPNQYIDILVDLNGKYGNNILGDDVIPVRIFKNGDVVPGIVNNATSTNENYYNNSDYFRYNVVLNTLRDNALATKAVDLRTPVDMANSNSKPKYSVSFREAVCRTYGNDNQYNFKAEDVLKRYYGEQETNWCTFETESYQRAPLCACAETKTAECITRLNGLLRSTDSAHCTIELAKPKSSAFARLFGL